MKSWVLVGGAILWLTGCTSTHHSKPEVETAFAPVALPAHLTLSLAEVRAINFLCLPGARIAHATYSELVGEVRVVVRRDIACSSLDQTVTLLLICTPNNGVCVAMRTNRPAGELYQAIRDATGLTQ